MTTTKLTKTQRVCLINAGIYPLRVTATHDDYPTQAKDANDKMYGGHTLHSLISPCYLSQHGDRLRLTEDGLMQLPAPACYVVTAIRCLKESLGQYF